MLPNLMHLRIQHGAACSTETILPIAMKRSGTSTDGEVQQPAKTARLDELAAYTTWLNSDTVDELDMAIKHAIEQCGARFAASDARHINARELAITRMLQSNHVIRSRFGLEPFFPPDASVGYLYVPSDATTIDMSSVKDNTVTFVRSWSDVGQQAMSRHALTILRASDHNSGDPSFYLIDSNGAHGSHALRLHYLEQPAHALHVLDTRPVQAEVQTTELWRNGQVLGKFMGWCSLWTLCLCELVSIGGLDVKGVQRLLSPNDDQATMRLLVIVRESTIRSFHRAVQWLEYNGYSETLQFKLLNPLKSSNADSATQHRTLTINGQALSVDIDEDHVQIGACKRRRALDFDTHGYSVFLRWEIVTGPLMFTVGVPFALKDLKHAIHTIRDAIESYFNITLPPFRDRGDSGTRSWILDDCAVYVPSVTSAETRALTALRNKLKTKLRERYKQTDLEWVRQTKRRVRTNALLNVDGNDRAFVFKDLDFTTAKVDGAVNNGADPDVLYKNALTKAFPMWKNETASGLTDHDLIVTLTVTYGSNQERASHSFGIDPNFNGLDVGTLVDSMKHIKALTTLTTQLLNIRQSRSLKVDVVGKNSTRSGTEYRSLGETWLWVDAERLILETINKM